MVSMGLLQEALLYVHERQLGHAHFLDAAKDISKALRHSQVLRRGLIQTFEWFSFLRSMVL